MDVSSSAQQGGWVAVGEAKMLSSTGRLHVCVQGRYVSVLRIKGKLTCIDSICFHAGGPLTLGDIEDIDGKACLVCPWHNYKIDAFTGDKYYQAVTWQDGKMVPGGWKSNGPRHRVHQVEERPDGHLYVQLNTQPGELPSDEYAFNATCGGRITNSPNTPSARSAAAVGADGKRSGLSRATQQQGACGPGHLDTAAGATAWHNSMAQQQEQLQQQQQHATTAGAAATAVEAGCKAADAARHVAAWTARAASTVC